MRVDEIWVLLAAIERQPETGKDPGVLDTLRRALAESVEIRDAAIVALLAARDTASLPKILALAKTGSLEGSDLFNLAGEAIVYLDGSTDHVAELRAIALERGLEPSHVDTWMASLEKLIAKRDKKKKKKKK